jgi:hypothetical protein
VNNNKLKQVKMETITKTFGKISVDNVSENQYKPSMDQAQIRQVVTRTYPSAKISNSHADSLFSINDFDLEEGQKYEQNRVTWIPVPKGTTAAQVEAKLKANPKARIYRVLSLKPILTDSQISAIESGLTTLEAIADRQAVKNSEGEYIQYNEQVQYAANFFSLQGKEDEDHRPALDGDEADVFASSEEGVHLA